MYIKGRNFLTLGDFSKLELTQLLDIAVSLKQDNKLGKTHHILKNKTLILIFAKPSLRTRVSFEIGIQQLGGTALTLKQDEISLGVRETIADTARVLSRYADGVMIRTFDHKDVEEFAKWSDIPVINGLTDSCHPCQVLADLLTIKERFNKLEGLKLTYVGDGNNMAHSLLVGCAIMGIDITIAHPKGYEPDQAFVEKAKSFALASGSKVEVTTDPVDGVKNANIVYTDVWASMGQEDEAEARKEIFKPYQINSELLKHASADAIVLHCLPAHRGEEISEEVLEKFADVIFDEAENRLHAQKAVMASIM